MDNRTRTIQSMARRMGLLVLLTIPIAVLAEPIVSRAEHQIEWRRTVRGWETTDSWPRSTTSSIGLHPLILGSLELLISIGAMVAFSREDFWTTATQIRLRRSGS